MKRSWICGLALTAVMLLSGLSFADQQTGFMAVFSPPVYQVLSDSAGPGDVVFASQDAVLSKQAPAGRITTTHYSGKITDNKVAYKPCAWRFEPISKPIKVPITI